MRKISPIAVILIYVLSTAQMCSSKQDVSPEEIATSCFSNESLTSVSWQKDQLTAFQQPKSGPLTVVVYSYKNEHFLAFENGFDSGPASHIFDCSGVTLGKRAINYNEFYGNNKRIKILLEGKY
ncbi:hypothetical protein ACAW74_18345 [Fibrella sp. WM1]|uniref:hypothetical protein n=1 Tax=Fibrella musci TaxID=3242485 RepID=UPI00351FC53D